AREGDGPVDAPSRTTRSSPHRGLRPATPDLRDRTVRPAAPATLRTAAVTRSGDAITWRYRITGHRLNGASECWFTSIETLPHGLMPHSTPSTHTRERRNRR